MSTDHTPTYSLHLRGDSDSYWYEIKAPSGTCSVVTSCRFKTYKAMRNSAIALISALQGDNFISYDEASAPKSAKKTKSSGLVVTWVDRVRSLGKDTWLVVAANGSSLQVKAKECSYKTGDNMSFDLDSDNVFVNKDVYKVGRFVPSAIGFHLYVAQ